LITFLATVLALTCFKALAAAFFTSCFTAFLPTAGAWLCLANLRASFLATFLAIFPAFLAVFLAAFLTLVKIAAEV